MASSAERNAEIWSTRVQKELLALTTSTKESGLLPAFITVDKHQLDITQGRCLVSFKIEAPADPDATTPPGEALIIMLDASLRRGSDGKVDASLAAYPFAPPDATLVSGQSVFPSGSTVQNGSPVSLACDWTPSLHLTDAILNVGLQVKESISQGEPFHAPPPMADDAVDELVKGASRLGSWMAKSARDVASSISDTPSKKFSMSTKRQMKKKATAQEINVNDQINLLESPWVDCQGLYSCKAIRRPAFVEDAISIATSKQGPNTNPQVRNSIFDEDDGEIPENFNNYMKLQAGSITKVAGAGFAGLGSTFRSFAASAKSVMEESFLMITDTHIVEIRSSKLNLSAGTVTFAVPIDLLAKLKFRREESISLFFKPAPTDPLIMMCPDSADAVQQIQYVLKRHGVKGKHTNAATQKAIHEALQLVQEIQAKERALEYQPSVERVNEIMDLYRQAAERFEVAGDVRHEEVVVHMRKFLAQPLAASILDGSFKPEPVPKKVVNPGEVPQGEVLECTKEQIEDGDEDGNRVEEKKDDQDFEENIDKLVNEAKTDFANMTMEGENLDKLLEGNDPAAEGDLGDLDAMLSAADKELEDLMAS